MQSSENNDFISNATFDNVLSGTNGYITVTQVCSGENTVINSTVMMHGVYHKEDGAPRRRHAGISSPTDTQVTATLCTCELAVKVNADYAMATGTADRHITLDGGVYEINMPQNISMDGSLLFDRFYRRVVSGHDLDTFVGELTLNNFQHMTPKSEALRTGDSSGADSGKDAIEVEISYRVYYDASKWSPTFSEDRVSLLQSHTSGVMVGVTSRVTADMVTYGADGTLVVTTLPVETTRIEEEGMDSFQESQQGTQNNSFAAPISSPTVENAILSSMFAPSTHPEVAGMRDMYGGGEDITTSGHRGSTEQLYDEHNYICCRTARIHLHPQRLPHQIRFTLMTRCRDGEGFRQALRRPFPNPHCLIEQQPAVFRRFWDNFELDIQPQYEVHPGRMRMACLFNCFRLFSTALACGPHIAIQPRGPSASGNSTTFDLQAYLFHGIFFTFTFPEHALGILWHLHSMLPEARQNARKMALPRGALFPRRTGNGEESERFMIARPPAFYINAHIVYLVTLYFEAVSDIPMDTACGLLTLLFEAVRVFPQLGEWHEHGTVFSIDHAQGPDEYSGPLPGNFFLNFSSKRGMLSAADLSVKQQQVLGEEAFKSILNSIGMTEEELFNLETTAGGIYIRRGDIYKVYPVHDGFDSRESWTGEKMNHPISLYYHPLVIHRHKLCKLPDVLLAMMLYPDRFSKQEVLENLAYYEPLCTLDAPESLGILAALTFCYKKGSSKPLEWLRAFSHLDLDNLMYSAEEGLHLSSMSSTWIAIVFGIGGVQIRDGVLHMSPALPSGLEHVIFSITWRGATMRTTIFPHSVEFQLMSGRNFRFLLRCPNGSEGYTRVHLINPIRPNITLSTSASFWMNGVPEAASDFDGVLFNLDALYRDLIALHYTAWCHVLESLFEAHRTLRGVDIPPLGFDEYMELVVYQADEREISFSGINNVLLSRGIQLELGNPGDAECVETRYGLANSKISELGEMLAHTKLNMDAKMVALITDLHRHDIKMAVVSTTRSLKELLSLAPGVIDMLQTTVDGEEAYDCHLGGRPHVDLFLHTARKMHVDPSRLLVFGCQLDRDHEEEDLKRFRKFFDVGGGNKSNSPYVIALSREEIPDTLEKLGDLVLQCTSNEARRSPKEQK